MPDTPRDEIYQTYIRARELERERGSDLSAKQFLDIVAPSKRGRSEASATRYMRKLRTGERSGALLYKRAKQDAGKSVNVMANINGRNTSANIRLPKSGSRLNLLKRGQQPVQEYILAQSQRNTPGDRDDENAEDVTLVGARSIEHTPSGTKDIGKI